jgi:hypothetical protein
LPAAEEQGPTELAGHDPSASTNVVGVVPAHQPHLQPDARPLDGGEHPIGPGEVERERLLAQDVFAGGGRRLDDLTVMDRRDRDKDGVDTRSTDRGDRVAECLRTTDLLGEAPGRAAIDVTDRDNPELGRTGRDQTGVVPAHAPGTDDRQADPGS